MGKIVDIKGKKFGRLTVLECVGIENHKAKWLCVCDCGKRVVVAGSDLRLGNTKSCGCYHSQRAKEVRTKHGKTETRLYSIWTDIKTRCYNKNREKYKIYGARGIKVCDEWVNDFQAFYNWAIENGYQDNLSIDRIDVNSNYEPNNCRWATAKEQANNTRTNHCFIIDNEKLTLKQISEKYNLNYKTLMSRIWRKWDINKAINKPIRKSKCKKNTIQ